MTQISPDYTFGRKVMRNHVEVGTPKRFGCSPDDLLHGLYQSSVEALMSNTFSTSFVTEEQFVVLNLVLVVREKQRRCRVPLIGMMRFTSFVLR